jgi:hypothetical protein
MFFVTFRLFVIFCILAQFGAEADQFVECDYRDYYRCAVRKVDLSKKTANEKFSFSGTQEEKKNATRIWFRVIGRVAHVPQNLAEKFPKLTDLWIWYSEIPIVKNNLLGPQFSWIETLTLRDNKIQIVEGEAFKHLHNLVMIWLQENQIQSVSAGVFQNNRKLKLIRIHRNKIKMIAPGTFQHLNQLVYVSLRWNDCVDKEIGCLDCDPKTVHTELNRDLNACFENHKKSSDLLNEGENKNFVKIILKKIKKSKTCKNFCFQINFRIFKGKKLIKNKIGKRNLGNFNFFWEKN